MGNRIILIDDDRDFGAVMAGKLRAMGYENLMVMDNPLEAAAVFENGDVFDLALIDMTMPEMDGLALLDHIKNTSPGTECIMLTAINESPSAVECLRKGAYDYLIKPVTKAVLSISLPKAMERKRLLDILAMDKRRTHGELDIPTPFKPIITQSSQMQRLLREAELHAACNVPILITGESGTGKELLARAIHTASSRSSFPFTPINTASISSSLFEAELFGTTRDDINNIADPRQGFLEHTHQGTLFLDEISDLSITLQGKLLSVLQDGVFSRLGSSERVQINLRLIAATSEDLDGMMARSVFRKDLYYCIRAGWLHVPPLRNRAEDITLLANAFLEKHQPYSQQLHGITPEALAKLSAYSWPGNVRELKSVIQSAVNLARGNPIDECYLPEHLRSIAVSRPRKAKPDTCEQVLPLAEMEKEHILNTYDRLNQNKTQTARALGIGLNTLRRKLCEYGRT